MDWWWPYERTVEMATVPHLQSSLNKCAQDVDRSMMLGVDIVKHVQDVAAGSDDLEVPAWLARRRPARVQGTLLTHGAPEWPCP